MTFVRRLEDDLEYAKKVVKVCGLETEDRKGIKLRVNLILRNRKVQNITYALYYNKLMEGDLGPQAPMGSVLWLGSTKDKLYQEGLSQLDSIFNKLEASTFLSLALDINTKDFSILSFMPDISTAFMELYAGDHKTLHLDDDIKLRNEWAIAVTIATLPFPMKFKFKEDVQVQGFNKYNLKHVTMYNLSFRNQGYYGQGYLGNIIARGENLREARRRVYRTLGNLRAPGLMYRRDIGMDAIRKHDQLIQWGWING